MLRTEMNNEEKQIVQMLKLVPYYEWELLNHSFHRYKYRKNNLEFLVGFHGELNIKSIEDGIRVKINTAQGDDSLYLHILDMEVEHNITVRIKAEDARNKQLLAIIDLLQEDKTIDLNSIIGELKC